MSLITIPWKWSPQFSYSTISPPVSSTRTVKMVPSRQLALACGATLFCCVCWMGVDGSVVDVLCVQPGSASLLVLALAALGLLIADRSRGRAGAEMRDPMVATYHQQGVDLPRVPAYHQHGHGQKFFVPEAARPRQTGTTYRGPGFVVQASALTPTAAHQMGAPRHKLQTPIWRTSRRTHSCLDIRARAGGGDGAVLGTNTSLVFVKPHAMTAETKKLVADCFASHNIQIDQEGTITGPEIDSKGLIDRHYYAIGSKAMHVSPADLPKTAEDTSFEDTYGVAWEDAIAAGDVFNANQACDTFGLTPDQLEEAWGAAKGSGQCTKIKSCGVHCGRVQVPGTDRQVFVTNGFYMSMRSAFTRPDAAIHYYQISWPSASLSWKQFRQDVIGVTDPTKANPTSLRAQILSQWEELGLASCPNVGDNGVHGSASPLESLNERNNWLGSSLTGDAFGAALVEAGVSEDTLQEWFKDPQVTLPDGAPGSLFDAMEDINSQECMESLMKVHELNK